MNEINVSKNGKKLDSKKYVWNPETKTFSTNESDLVLDFGSMDNVTINCVSVCTINCGNYCTIKCGDCCTIRCYWDTTIIPGKNCSIHFQYNEIFTLEKLIENEFQKILQTGELIKLTQIEYIKIELKENVFTVVLKEKQKINFYINDKENEELVKAISEDNHTKILMLENENNNQFIKHFFKTFKKVN